MSIGRLCRNLDIGLINKINSGWKPSGNKSLARGSRIGSKPRHASTYRFAHQNWRKAAWRKQHPDLAPQQRNAA